MKRSALLPLEKDVQAAVLIRLRIHPFVAWVERQNTGANASEYTDSQGRKKRRFFRFGFKGASDITGQLKNGCRLEVECKRPGQKPSEDQQAHIDRVNRYGGVAFWTDDAEDAIRQLEARIPEAPMDNPENLRLFKRFVIKRHISE